MRSLKGMQTFLGLLGAALLVIATPMHSAHAASNRTIILKAAGSGAVIGLAAGLASYPFAKSTGTVFAGAVVGALLGTVYGFHLVNQRDEAYQQVYIPPSELDRLSEMNFEREARLRRGQESGPEFTYQASVYRF
jgi:hypothetical protein